MFLEQSKIHHKKQSVAAAEALGNAELLCLGGYFDAAFEITTALSSDGPWSAGKHTALGDRIWRLHSLLCFLKELDCPAMFGEPALSYAELEEEAAEDGEDALSELLILGRLQHDPAGQGWDDAHIELVMEMREEDGKYLEYGLFSGDVELLLKHRLRTLLGTNGPNLLGGLLEDLAGIPSTDSDILVADEAEAYSSHFLCDCLEKCSSVFGEDGMPYVEEEAYTMMLAIDLLNEDYASAAIQAQRLLGEENRDQLLELGHWPPFREFMSTGAIGQKVGLEAEQVSNYLEEFRSRQIDQTASRPREAPAPQRSSTFDEFKAIVADSDLSQCNAIELEVPGHEETAIALQVDRELAFDAWTTGRSLVEKTHRWPVLNLSWGGASGKWEKVLSDDDLLFDRDVFSHEMFDGDRQGASVADLISGAQSIQLREKYREMAATQEEYFDEAVEYELEPLADAGATPPSAESVINELRSGDVSLSLALCKWLWAWRQEHPEVPALEADSTHIQWFEPTENEILSLLFLPTRNSWEVPAFIQWYGAETAGTEVVIAALKDWHDRYGAELVAHYGTMLQLTTSSRPADMNEAMQLAFEQDTLAPCTIAPSGVSLLEHAATLMHTNRWFLHDRP